MQLTLSRREAEILRDLLHDYLPELRREVAATDQRELRHALAERRELAERLLGLLDQGPH